MLLQAPGTILSVEEGQQQGILRAAEVSAGRRWSTEHSKGAVSQHDNAVVGAVRNATNQSSDDQGSVEEDCSMYCGSDFIEHDDGLEDGLCDRLAAEEVEAESDAFTEIGEAGGTEVVFVREAVAVWPSKTERIMGRLTLVKQHCVMFLAWLPYSHGTLREDGTFHIRPCSGDTVDVPANGRRTSRDGGSSSSSGAGGGGGSSGRGSGGGSDRRQSGNGRTRYAVHPFPLSDVKALRKHTPTVGWHYVVVVLVNGVTLPPLYFHSGGVKGFLSVLKQHVTLVKSSTHPETLLVNDTSDPLQRSLTSLELTDVLQGAPPTRSDATFALPVPQPQAMGATLVGVGAEATSGYAWASDVSGTSRPRTPVGGGGGSSSGDSYGPTDLTWRLTLPSNLGTTLLKLVQNAGAIAQTTSTWLFSDEQFPPTEYDPEFAGEGARRAAANAADVSTLADDGTAEVKAGRPAATGPLSSPTSPLLAGRDRTADANGGTVSGPDGRSSVTPASPTSAAAVEGASSTPNGATAATIAIAAVAAIAAATGSTVGGGGGGIKGAALAGVTGGSPLAPPPGDGCGASAETGGGDANRESLLMRRSSSDEEFEFVSGCSDVGGLRLGRQRPPAPPPISVEEWETMFDAGGRLLSEAEFRERIFTSGVEPSLRSEAWKYLLGLHPKGSTAAERLALSKGRLAEYHRLRQQWMSISPSQAVRFAKWRERRSRVEKDVRRTDRALPFYAAERGPNTRALLHLLLTGVMWNFDLGYCQGMSDLASPLLYVMRDESEAFWAFAALMDRVEGNFSSDQQGMHAQLQALRKLMQMLDPQLHSFLERHDALNYFFCFRWLLILFKREFRFEESLRLWECLWSCATTPHLHLYLCAAVLVHHRRAIMEQDLDFDGLLKFCVQLSGKLELNTLLRLAETLCVYAGPAGAECLAGLPKLAT